MPTDPRNSTGVAQAVQEVSEKAQLLVREEIALAKAELTENVTKLVKGAVVGIVAGVFALLGLLYLLHSLSWFLWKLVQGPGDENGADYWLGFLIVAVLLFVLGGIAGFLAARFIKKGSPPTPKMALEEAQLIRQTISSSTSTPAARTEARP
ncbi:MAG: phage holin family protein [Actinomycetota bacterium]|nr:phage holin family protein [Actinomycetota bacterium]